VHLEHTSHMHSLHVSMTNLRSVCIKDSIVTLHKPGTEPGDPTAAAGNQSLGA
jgi:hypothetical protein